MHTVVAVKNLLVQSGASWVLWLLFALSAGSIAIAIERWLYFRSKDDDVRALAAELDAHLANGSVAAALDALRPMRSVGAIVARAGLRLAQRGSAAADKGMQSAMAAERKALEARLAYLGTLGNNAPFVGLFGTVIGVILAFEQLGQATGAAGGGAASQVASAAVMAAIAEALVATAVGIGVALPAVAAYNYLQRRIAAMLDDAETLSNLVLAYLATGEAAYPSSRVEPARAAHGGASIDEPMNGEASRPEAA
ncbi:MotA/TolQ/ExbB proton channel family protein [Sorangium sp. So ce302]|uniref:MotA/TolQ/ExbB proton channel family protein n=1 Tax=Sorangium sp. So ce302 TaxID=3133297 RepID=UPI003F61AC0B